jgi:hypothetical protein
MAGRRLQVGVLLEDLCHRGGAALVAPMMWQLGTRARGDTGQQRRGMQLLRPQP